MERFSDKLLDVINEQDFCFTPEEMRIVEKAMRNFAAYEDAIESRRGSEGVADG